jgi:HSF-type DNA-binding
MNCHERKDDRSPRKAHMNHERLIDHLASAIFPIPESKSITSFRSFRQQQPNYSQCLHNERLLYLFHRQHLIATNTLPNFHLTNLRLDPRPDIRSLTIIPNQRSDQDTWNLEKLLHSTHEKTQLTYDIQIAQLTNSIERLKQKIEDQSTHKICACHDDLNYMGCKKGKQDPIHSFPHKLHNILSNPEFSHCITWLPHGRAWRIIHRADFERDVIPRYFRHGRFSSFLRQVSK